MFYFANEDIPNIMSNKLFLFFILFQNMYYIIDQISKNMLYILPYI